MYEKLKALFDNYNKFDLSNAVIDRIQELLDTMFDEETEVCPHCGKIFLVSENALEYEQEDGDYTCDCLSPENQASAMADMWYDEQND